MDKLSTITQIIAAVLGFILSISMILRIILTGQHLFPAVMFMAMAALSVVLFKTSIKEIKQ